jgi:NAD(P)-dependent dehydrogenase (short-subunit alcohol dehydrogenase family)
MLIIFIADTMSMHAVTGATKWAAQALSPDIRVNSIHPGSIETNLQDPLLDKSPEESAKARAMIAGWHPMKRIAKPAEVANVALFLASDASSFMTGSMVTVDGGILSVNGLG